MVKKNTAIPLESELTRFTEKAFQDWSNLMPEMLKRCLPKSWGTRITTVDLKYGLLD